MGVLEDTRTWASQNKLKAVFLGWASAVGGVLAYQWTKPIPTSLKIIHARVYAQALTLAGLGVVGLVDYYEHRTTTRDELAYYKEKIREFEDRLLGHPKKEEGPK
eukprot:jgi/Botrbrau1/14135/Bobra.182_3s0076.1